MEFKKFKYNIEAKGIIFAKSKNEAMRILYEGLEKEFGNDRMGTLGIHKIKVEKTEEVTGA